MELRLRLIACLVTATVTLGIAPSKALDPSATQLLFSKLVTDKTLADPSVLVIDEKTGEVIYESNSLSPRRPASVLKLISATAALTYLDQRQKFVTSVSLGKSPSTLVVKGQLDPWISVDAVAAIKMNRTSLPHLAASALSALQTANQSTKKITVYYTGLYSQDVANFKTYFLQRKVIATMKQVSLASADSESAQEIIMQQSPEISEILKWTLTWSDNLLAERLARLASRAAGNSADEEGVNLTFHEVLNSMGIDPGKLLSIDASGLSKSNRVSAQIIGQLLLKVRNDPKFVPLIDGLPVAGMTGTLKKRFIKTAPQAVGLVKAKTGTLNGTVTLAGYLAAGDREYIFVIIADRIPKGYIANDLARKAVDRILGKIATPLIVASTETPIRLADGA